MPHIEVENISVELPVFEVKARSLRRELAAMGRRHAMAESGDGCVTVRALRDVSFSLKRGERLGLIGRNGAGKSTLLRALAGIYRPTSGRITSSGRRVPLLDITLGLDDNSTGRQNIKLRGLFMGLGQRWVAEHEAEIAAFSELGDYLDMPVRTYSTGMRMRLAFSIAMTVEADILLLDEVLGVGDSAFQAKAKARLREVAGRAGIVVLALHSSPAIMELCDRALWLDAGGVRMFGNCHDVVREYDDFMHHRMAA
jgi:ABC-2 type transport system ATP-binding protein/lipopolysaccharide transport system ATP-binding protein